MNCSMLRQESGFCIEKLFLCMKLNIRKWRSTPRVPVLAAAIVAFGFWTTGGVSQVAEQMGLRVSPWLLPHIFANPLMMSLFGFFTLFFYSDAPFVDSHTPFVVVRAGRKNWIAGQLLYLFVSSVLYTLFWYGATLVPVLPRLTVSPDWGEMIGMLADGSAYTVAAENGITLGYYVNAELCDILTGLQATGLALLLMWLVSLFLATLMFCLNLIARHNAGVVAAGIFSYLPVFAASYFVLMIWGGRLYYISPVSWCSLYSLDISGRGTVPGIGYAVAVLLFLSISMMVLSAKWYCSADFSVEEHD